MAKYNCGVYHIPAIAGFDADVDFIAQGLVAALVGLLDVWQEFDACQEHLTGRGILAAADFCLNVLLNLWREGDFHGFAVCPRDLHTPFYGLNLGEIAGASGGGGSRLRSNSTASLHRGNFTVVLPTSLALQTDTWVKATWDDFIATMDTAPYNEGRGYFDNGSMRVEMAALGGGHARQNSVVSKVVSLFGMVRAVRLAEFTNGSFHKTGERGCQPDVAFYIGSDFRLPPQDNAPIDVDVYGPPTLAIEIGGSSFKDDLGAKRLLYERLGVSEYWVVNVADQQVVAFVVAEGGSRQIRVSGVLPGLEITLIEEALHRSQTEDDTTLMGWLMKVLA